MKEITSLLETLSILDFNQSLVIVLVPLLIILALFEFMSFVNKRKLKN
jgi:hypothetical protein